MAAFGADGRCLMRALREELDDPDPQDCGVCAVCTAPRFDGPLDPVLVREAALHLRSRPLHPRHQEDGARRRGQDEEARRRRARRGGPRARAARRRRLGSARPGRPPRGPLRRRAGRGRRRGRAHAGARRCAGSPRCRRSAAATLVPDFAQRLADGARTSRSTPVLERVGDQPAAARDDQLRPAGRERARRVRGHARPAAGRRACSSTTSASAAGRSRWSPGQLRRKGSGPVSSARAVHGV